MMGPTSATAAAAATAEHTANFKLHQAHFGCLQVIIIIKP
jgi:hypothetical protein